MIELKHLSKVYDNGKNRVEAIKDISLTVEDGDIFGIIGLSGAGKSTLIRCINFLEKPHGGDRSYLTGWIWAPSATRNFSKSASPCL